MSEIANWMDEARKNAGWLMVVGVLEIIVGVMAILMPAAGGIGVTLFVGAGLLVGGIFRLIAAFGADSFGSGALGFLWGLIVAVTGFYVLMNPDLGLVSLTMVLAVMLFAGGLIQTVLSFKMKPVKGWGWMLAGGIASLLLSFMAVWEFPVSGLWLIGTLVGVHLMFAGMSTVTIASAARQATKSA